MSQYRKTIADLWFEGSASPPGTDPAWISNLAEMWGHAVTVLAPVDDLYKQIHGLAHADSVPFARTPWSMVSIEMSVGAWDSVEGKERQERSAVLCWENNDGDVLALSFLLRPDGIVQGPLGMGSWRPNADGSVASRDVTMSYRAEDKLGAPGRVWNFDHVWAAIFALSLTSCRNVSASEHRPPPALSKRHAERHGRPLCRYYTLDIEPMRKVLKTEGRMDEVGLARALHLCRGHFKDYREGGGLFGRNKGLYWWDANVRGTIKAGVVAKDYAIKPPKPGRGEP